MGLIFNKKSSSGSVVNRKKISDSSIDRKDIREMSGKLGFTRTGARQEFQKILDKAQLGGVTREEVHEGLQKMILDGHVTKDQAHRMAKEMGIDRKDLARFKDISESHSYQKGGGVEALGRHTEADKSALKEKLDSSGSSAGKISKLPSGAPISNNSPAMDSSATKQKPSSVWNILNKRKAT